MKEVEFLQFLAENIVDVPEAIQIESQVDELWTLLTIQVDPKDMGVIIGKNGSTIQALRSILRLRGIKNGKKVTLKIAE